MGRKIITYLYIWLALFLLLCVISLVKNWDAFKDIMMNKMIGLIVAIVLIGAVFTGLVSIVTGGRR